MQDLAKCMVKSGHHFQKTFFFLNPIMSRNTSSNLIKWCLHKRHMLVT